MTKADLVAEISEKTGIEKVQVQATVETFMESIKSSLTKGENVYLRGFGSFIVKERAAKTGRNISKNTTIIILLTIFQLSNRLKLSLAKLKRK